MLNFNYQVNIYVIKLILLYYLLYYLYLIHILLSSQIIYITTID